jgi:uncharacterized protein YuzE
MRLDGHYDPRADVAWLRFEDYDPQSAIDEESATGLREFDLPTGQTVGVEVRKARKNLPAEFLAMLQRPPASARDEGAVHVGVEAHRRLERLTDAWG